MKNLLFSGKTVTGVVVYLVSRILNHYGVVVPEADIVSMVLMGSGVAHKVIKVIKWPDNINNILVKLGLV